MKTTLVTVSSIWQSPAIIAAMAEVERLEAKRTELSVKKDAALSLLRECRRERVAAVAGELDACPGICWTNEERAEAAYEEASDLLDRCKDDYWEAIVDLQDLKQEQIDAALKGGIAPGVAMIPQQAQQQQARDMRTLQSSTSDIRIAALGHLGFDCDPESHEASLWIVTDGSESRDFASLEDAQVYADLCEGLGYIPSRHDEPAMVQQQAQQQQACAAIVMDWEQQRDDLLDRIEGTEHLQRLVQRSVDHAAAGLGTTTATQDSVEALRLHAVDLRQKLAALDGASVLAMVPQIAQQQQARDNRGLRVITNPNPATHCSHCGRRLTDHISVRHGIGPVCRSNGGATMRDLFTSRSDFDVEDLLDVVLVVDLDRGGRSVSNDAAGVIDDLRKAGLIRHGVPVVYRDSSGTWDQLRVKDGRFAGFASVGAMTREDAISWARAN